MSDSRLGDMDAASFRTAGQRLLDWTTGYLENGDRYPVLSRVEPGWIRSSLPLAAPEQGESMETIFRDFERILLPGVTHWNNPGFLAYFASSGSGPGVLAEFLTAALNQQAMLWETSPAATELEEVALAWLRQMLGLPETFEGVIYDGGSASNLHALAAALFDVTLSTGQRVNASGEVLLSHTRLRGCYPLRLAVGQIRTTEAHVARAWELLRDGLTAMRAAC